MMTPIDLVGVAAALAGFGAMISLIVNVGKAVGIIKDGQAQTWVTGMNLLLVAGLYVGGLVGYDLAGLDGMAGSLAEIGIAVFSFMIQMKGSQQFHWQVRGTPMIGKSFSFDESISGAKG